MTFVGNYAYWSWKLASKRHAGARTLELYLIDATLDL